MNKIKVLFAKLVTFFKKEVAAVNTEFTTIVGPDAAAKFEAEVESILKTSIGKIAVSVVAGIKSVANDLTDTQKRDQAVEQILALAKAQGLNVTTSVVHLFIELAVSYLKTKI
jgi:hypothetical protein